MADADNSSHPISWLCQIFKQVTRSILGSEVVAHRNAFGMAFSMEQDIENMIQTKIFTMMFKDSFSLFEDITKRTITAERGLLTGISVKNAYKKMKFLNSTLFVLIIVPQILFSTTIRLSFFTLSSLLQPRILLLKKGSTKEANSFIHFLEKRKRYKLPVFFSMMYCYLTLQGLL